MLYGSSMGQAQVRSTFYRTNFSQFIMIWLRRCTVSSIYDDVKSNIFQELSVATVNGRNNVIIGGDE